MIKVLCLGMGLFLLLLKTHAQFHLGLEGQGMACNLPGNATGGPSGILSRQKTPRFAPGGGLWADIHLSDYIDFQPHLDISPKGALLFENGQNAGYFHMTYLELPLRLMYRIPVGYDDFFIGGGVYGAVGLSGSFRTTPDSVPGPASKWYNGAIRFGDLHSPSDLHLTPWDAGYTGAASYQFSFGLVFHLEYERGFVNISPQGGGRMHNQGLSLGLGYLFHYNTRD